jgi:putative nucleotidyltransferase with HDIG domain
MGLDEARSLLVLLGAPARLVRYGELVAEAGEVLLAAMRRLGVQVDEDLVRAGCLLHDAGKAQHPAELHSSGANHEASGERLLLARGVEPRVARCCRSHAQWRSMAEVSLEELVVALADVTWKAAALPSWKDA